MERFNLILAAIIVAITALIIFFVSIPRIDRFLNISSVAVCANANKYNQKVSGSVTAEYPVLDLYQKCLKATK